MKRTDLAKNDALKLANRLKQTLPPDRFARASNTNQETNTSGSSLMEKLLGKAQTPQAK